MKKHVLKRRDVSRPAVDCCVSLSSQAFEKWYKCWKIYDRLLFYYMFASENDHLSQTDALLEQNKLKCRIKRSSRCFSSATQWTKTQRQMWKVRQKSCHFWANFYDCLSETKTQQEYNFNWFLKSEKAEYPVWLF